MQVGQALSSRQNSPANAAQSHPRRGDTVSAFGDEKVAENAAGRKKERTESSDGTGTRAARLVGRHEVKSATSARELMSDTSKFLARGVWTQIRKMVNDDGEPRKLCAGECVG